MRKIITASVEKCRLRSGPLASNASARNNGAFLFKRQGAQINCIISDGGGWDHVSVSVYDPRPRVPTWDEMQWVKEQFFGDEETVVQFHPKKSEYLNCCPFCLHMWRKQDGEHELPPSWMVAPKES